MKMSKVSRAAIGAVLFGAVMSCGGDDKPSGGSGATNPPAAPTDLTAAPVAGPAVHVTWKDQSSDEDNFILERKEGSGEFSVLSNPPFNETAHHDATALAGKTYTYRISAKNAKGTSAFSNDATATVP